eukprot:COSAG02_NODE_15214_length_1193_cov_1.542962_2_plen_103_part_00
MGLHDSRRRTMGGIVGAAAWLQLARFCVGQLASAGGRRCPDGMFELHELDGTPRNGCGDCYSCSPGQMCIQRGERAGCLNCSAGQEDQDFDPMTACTGIFAL